MEPVLMIVGPIVLAMAGAIAHAAEEDRKKKQTALFQKWDREVTRLERQMVRDQWRQKRRQAWLRRKQYRSQRVQCPTCGYGVLSGRSCPCGEKPC